MTILFFLTLLLNTLFNIQVVKAKEADIELDMFDSYEEYLDSKLEEAERRQDAIDRAYHRLQLLWSLDPQGPLLTDKEFNRAKEALGPQEKATARGSRELSEVVPRLEEVCALLVTTEISTQKRHWINIPCQT